jgi:hypothetical protein
VRFEKSFTNDVCKLLKASGCIGVSGGLEVASDRLLKLIDKGITLEQVSHVNKNFIEAGIMVHAYLMYGYPTQTVQETIDSLEVVRQMFKHKILQSGFWHQFALTVHSPIGLAADEAYNIVKSKAIGTFANNDLEYEDKSGIDHSQFSAGLKKSLFNFMQGIGLEEPLDFWFSFKNPKTSIDKNLISNFLLQEPLPNIQAHQKVIFLGAIVQVGTAGAIELFKYKQAGYAY